MSHKALLRRSGIQVTFSSIDVPSFRASSLVNIRAERFKNLQNEVVHRDWSSGIVFLLHLIAFDAFDPHDFDLLRNHTAAIFPTASGRALEISFDGEVIQRHLLNSISLRFSGTPIVWSDAQKRELVNALKSTKLYADIEDAEVLMEVRCDQLAWAFQRLPFPIFSHFSGLVVCVPLSREAYERALTGLVSLRRSDDNSAESDANSGDLLDATENSTSDNNSAALIQQALDCLYVEENEAARSCLMRWNRSLTALAPKLHAYSPQVGLIISWIAHVVEHGTSKKGRDADLTTRRRYATVAAIPIFRAVQSLPTDPRKWKKDERVAAFIAVMSSSSNTDKRALSAAIASFQFFLQEAFELRPLDAGLKDFIPVTKPRAQYISISEVERASAWFVAARMEDERLRSRLQVALWLAYDTPFRIDELLHLRKGNITKLPDASFEISIIPQRGGQLKTSAATRRVWVRLPTACAFLARLMEQRERENWSSKDMLFGSGVEGTTPYRKRRLRYLLLLALKATTGDSDMTIHALRHSWVCRELEPLLLSSEICNFNRLSHFAAQVGHESVHTTLEYYFHAMEVPLRLHIDASLVSDLQWTSESGARYTGMTATALRQRASRAQQTVGALIWTTLNAIATEQNAALARGAAGWGIPDAPDLTDKSLTPLTPALVMRFLLDSEKSEHSPEVLAQRYALSNEQGRMALRKLAEIRAELSQAIYARRSTSDRAVDRGSPHLLLHKVQQAKYAHIVTSLDEIPHNRDFLKRGVEAWKSLRNRYGYIGLMDPTKTYPFLSLLQYLGFQAYNFDVVITHCSEPGRSASIQAQVESSFHSAMVAHPNYIHGAPPHATRPAAYLQWHPAKSEKKVSANSDLKGMDAILLVLAVFLDLTSEKTP